MFRKRETREEWEARAQILPGETFATAFQRVKAENKAIEDKERLEIEKWTKEVEETIVIGNGLIDIFRPLMYSYD